MARGNNMQNVTNATNFSATVHSIKQTHIDGPLGKEVSAAAHEKNAVRKAEASLEEASISTAERPMELFFKATVEGINEVLGENTIQGEFDSASDVSSVAEKIVSLSVASYPQYVEQSPDVPADEIAVSFVNAIVEGLDKGVAETKNLLSGLEALDEASSSIIDTVYDEVKQGLQSFLDSFSETELSA